MIVQMYAILDKAVGAFITPMFFRSQGEAVRAFTQACQDGQSNFCKHPNDYTLFRVGDWDDATGKLVPLVSPTVVIEAFECIARSDAKSS